MNRLYIGAILVFFAGAICFGQSTYRGLTPGKTTRAEVESVIGSPVKRLSATFFEYKEAYDANNPVRPNKIFVQYREGSPSAVVERIELVCDRPLQTEGRDVCSDIFSRSGEFARLPKRGREYASILEKENSGIFKTTAYYGPPSLEVRTWSRIPEKETYQSRLGLYSAELFDSAVPRNCTGTFLGEWDTNRGRLVLTAIPGTHPENWDADDIKGEYSTNKGTVTAHSRNSSTLTGEWKDATGSGTFEIKINKGQPFEPNLSDRKMFTGTWERKTGNGPKKGTWDGRCVETTQ